MNNKPAGVVFDLDGTLIDNNAYHIEAWKFFYAKHGLEFSDKKYRDHINGKINRDIFPLIFERPVSEADIESYTEEKEDMYRELYAPHIKAIPGLIDLLDDLQQAGIPLAIATSGLPVNIRFMFEHVPIEKYFKIIVDSTMVIKGKPNPEIFLTAASMIKAVPGRCIAFEDSVAGINSAKAANMKVVALTTTHKTDELDHAHFIIKDYTKINIADMQQLLDK